MYEQLKKTLETFAEMDLSETTNFRAMVKLRDLLTPDLGYDTASKVAGYINIELIELSDEQLDDLIIPFTKTIFNFYKALEEYDFPEEVFLESVKKMHLSLK